MPVTRSQRWSKVAFECVREVAEGKAKQAPRGGFRNEKYKTSCNKMPGLVHQSGAVQALVFQVARDHEGTVYVDHLSRAYFGAPRTYVDLIKHAQSLDVTAYMPFTRDLAEIAQWFRRFAQVELDAESDEG